MGILIIITTPRVKWGELKRQKIIRIGRKRQTAAVGGPTGQAQRGEKVYL